VNDIFFSTPHDIIYFSNYLEPGDAKSLRWWCF